MGRLIVWGAGLVLLLALFAPFRVEVQIRKNEREDFLALKYRLGPWQLFQSRITPLLGDLPNFLSAYLLPAGGKDLPGMLPKVTMQKIPFPFRLTSFFPGRDLLSKAGISHLEWSTRVGLANPAVTGITAGCLWYLKHRLYRYLAEATAGVSAVPRFQVVPDFMGTTLDLEFRCIFAFRGGHIITAAWRTFWLILCSFLRGDKVEQPSH